MDGHFVPNISMGALVYKQLKGKVDMVFDVHIMVADPLKYAKDFVDAGADYLTFHYEAVTDVPSVINHIKSLGCKVGISVKPNTEISVLDPYLSELDLVLVMSVEPGFGGQSFIPSSLEKVKYLLNKRNINEYTYLIEIDGGINKETAPLAVNAGVDIIVAGSYIFQSNNRKNIIEELNKL